MNNTDFKTYSEGQNLKNKLENANTMREIFEQDKTSYGIKNIDWDSWKAGTYD
jgi:hypothetical protein